MSVLEFFEECKEAVKQIEEEEQQIKATQKAYRYPQKGRHRR